MALSKAAQRLIMRDDAIRRLLREQGIEQAWANEYDYAHARNLTGVPAESNRQHKASDDCWKRGLRATRTVGVADWDTRYPSVKVTSNGETRIAPIAEFRKPRTTVKRASAKVVTVNTELRAMPVSTTHAKSTFDARHADQY